MNWFAFIVFGYAFGMVVVGSLTYTLGKRAEEENELVLQEMAIISGLIWPFALLLLLSVYLFPDDDE